MIYSVLAVIHCRKLLVQNTLPSHAIWKLQVWGRPHLMLSNSTATGSPVSGLFHSKCGRVGEMALCSPRQLIQLPRKAQHTFPSASHFCSEIWGRQNSPCTFQGCQSSCLGKGSTLSLLRLAFAVRWSLWYLFNAANLAFTDRSRGRQKGHCTFDGNHYGCRGKCRALSAPPPLMIAY